MSFNPLSNTIPPLDQSAAVNSVSGTTNQITVSPTTGAVVVSLPSAVTTGQYIANLAMSSSMSQGAIDYGTLNFTDANVVLGLEGTATSYFQAVLQNVSTGSTASTDLVIGNSSMTATTNYLNIGVNSTGFTGTPLLNTASAGYITMTSAPLILGTTTSNVIDFVVNNGTAAAVQIDTSGRINTPNQIISTLATGTAPFSVTSTTQVANLNAATAGSATNIAAGTTNQIPYQTAAGTTSFYSGANYGVQTYTSAGVPSSIAGAAGVLVGSTSAIPAFSTSPTLTQLTASASTGGVTLILNNAQAAISGTNYSSTFASFEGNYWNGSASAIDSWTIQNVMGTGTNPIATLTITHNGASRGGTSGGSQISVNGGNAVIGGNGNFTKYNKLSVVGSGVPAEVNQILASAQAANYNSGSAVTVFTPSAASMVRITYTQMVTQAATTSCVTPSLTVGWTDVGGIARTNAVITTGSTNATTVYNFGSIVVYTNASTAVTVTSAGYTSVGATPMQYALAVTTEVL